MCVSWAGRIESIDEEGTALVEVEGRLVRAATLLCPDVTAGQWVVLATGLVLRRISPREARRLRAATARAV